MCIKKYRAWDKQREYEDWTFTRSEVMPACEAKKLLFCALRERREFFYLEAFQEIQVNLSVKSNTNQK